MKNLLIILLSLSTSCSRPSPTEKDLRENLNKTLHIEMFECVRNNRYVLSYKELRSKYEFLSVVYLENGCQPCYPKFIEWHQKINSLEMDNNHTVLFVIQGASYSDFMEHVLDLDYVDDKYYTIMDPHSKFLNSNKDIPIWMINASILIDRENKIKMVGPPWINEDMKDYFYKTVNNEQ